MFTLKNLVESVGFHTNPEMRNHAIGGVEGALEALTHGEYVEIKPLLLIRQVILASLIITAMVLTFWGLSIIPMEAKPLPLGYEKTPTEFNRWDKFMNIGKDS